MSNSLIRYHSCIGHTYMPNTKLRVPRKNGGGYLVRTNAAGYRSDREFVKERRPGTFRALLFGDSQTAGDGIANLQRFSDLLEKALPNLEIYNYSVSATGTDQHFLTYQENAAIEHDLRVISLNVENIRRIKSRIFRAWDINDGEFFRFKPYYQIENHNLVLHNVPVPKQTWTKQTIPAEFLSYVYPPLPSASNSFFRPFYLKYKSMLPEAVKSKLRWSLWFMGFRRPLQDYDTPNNPTWLLLRKILEIWLSTGQTPVLIVLIPQKFFLEEPYMAKFYQTRFHELTKDTGCHLYDPLPDLLNLTAKEQRSLWIESDGHLSAHGHETMARLLTPILESFMGKSQEIKG